MAQRSALSQPHRASLGPLCVQFACSTPSWFPPTHLRHAFYWHWSRNWPQTWSWSLSAKVRQPIASWWVKRRGQISLQGLIKYKWTQLNCFIEIICFQLNRLKGEVFLVKRRAEEEQLLLEGQIWFSFRFSNTTFMLKLHSDIWWIH